MDSWFMNEYAALHRSERMQDAAKYRLLQKCSRNRRNLVCRMLAGMGHGMVVFGQYLQTTYEVPDRHQPSVQH